MLIIGSYNSSNSKNLNKTAINCWVKSHLIENHNEIILSWFDGVKKLGISSGASAPDILIEEVVGFLKKNLEVTVKYFNFKEEKVKFKLPKI